MKVTCLTAALVTCLATAGAAAQDTTSQQQDTAPAQAAPSTISVEAILTSALMDRVPQDTVSAIATPTEADTVYLWTRVSGAEAGTVLHHVWFKGDEQVADVELTINGSPWRTWSRKTIAADGAGAWRVEVRDSAGNVLGTVSFTVGS
ncbi:MAG: DUF2914 domain-containing protein [Gemmatimonadales bacterium]|nr:DUF2914 domain-containing protein [Gemmatimonadales bacterium]